jgi:hypothetical protein
LNAEIERLREESLRTSTHLEGAQVSDMTGQAWEYHTDPMLQLVHLFLAIPSYQAVPASIATALAIDGPTLDGLIRRLVGMGLVSPRAQGFATAPFNLHLETDSPIFGPYRILQRVLTLGRLQRTRVTDPDDYVFTAAFAADVETRRAIRALLVQLVKRAQKVAIAAPEERVFQLNLDLFEWR